jgi:electron transfer flavoprotein beta subunit
MNIIVCMKQVIDPETPLSLFKVDTEAKRVLQPKATPPVLNPFDENALEAALRIKDTQDARITVISMGRKLAKAVVTGSLAAGADQLILLEDDIFGDFDSYSTAYTLALAIKKIKEYDLILCGREAADTDAGQVGAGIAEILGIPSITIARKIEASNGKVRVERVLSEGYEVVEALMPALVTVSFELGDLREPSFEAFDAAGAKPVTVWNAQELGVDPGQMKRTNLLKLSQPVHEVRCEIVAGGSPEEAGANLALKLRETKVI